MDKALVFGTKDCRLESCQDQCPRQLVGLSVSAALHVVPKLSTGTCSLCRAAQPRAEICDSAALIGARSNCSRGANHRLRLCRCSWRQAGARSVRAEFYMWHATRKCVRIADGPVA